MNPYSEMAQIVAEYDREQAQKKEDEQSACNSCDLIAPLTDGICNSCIRGCQSQYCLREKEKGFSYCTECISPRLRAQTNKEKNKAAKAELNLIIGRDEEFEPAKLIAGLTLDLSHERKIRKRLAMALTASIYLIVGLIAGYLV